MRNVRDFGAVGDWETDDTAAFLAAAEVAMAHYDLVYVPAGAYRLTAPLNLTGTGVLRGDGPSISWLVWDGGDGFRYTATSAETDYCDVSGLTFRTRSVGGKAITVDFSAHGGSVPYQRLGLEQYSTFSIKDVFVQPMDEFGLADGWGTGLETIAAIYGVVRDCNFYGRRLINSAYSEAAAGTTGLFFHGSNNDELNNGFPYVFVLDNVNVAMTDVAVFFKCLEGGFLNDCNLVCVNTGVKWQGSWMQNQLNIANSHIAATTGALIDNITALSVNSTLFFNYRQDLVDQVSRGIVLSNGDNIIIQGNQFRGILNKMDAVTLTAATNFDIAHNLYSNVRNDISIT